MTKENILKQTEIGKISADWDVVTLKDVADVITGFPFKNVKYSFTDGIRVLRGENLNHRTFRWNKVKRWNDVDYSLDKYQLKENVVVLSMYGNVGKNKSVVSKKSLPLLLAQRVAAVIAKKENLQGYINQVILSDYFTRYCDQVKTGITIFHISKGQIENFVFAYPPNEYERQFISEIFSNLDAKIELNNENNTTLEKIANTIYYMWFKNFEFPDDDGKPYKSNHGKLENSEIGKIPNGWSAKTFGEIASMQRGFSYSGKEKTNNLNDDLFVTLNNIEDGGGFKSKFSWLKSDRLKERHFISEFDLIFANTYFGVGGSNEGRLLGCPALVFFPSDYNKQRGVFSHHVTKIEPFNFEIKYYLYHFLKSTQKDNSRRYGIGTTILGFDVDSFLKTKFIAVPPEKLLVKFNLLVKPLFDRIALNHKEILLLKKIRDTLLPKIMSGKIRMPREFKT